MASRKKKDPAALRTISLFTGKTVIEEAEALVQEEADGERPDAPRDFHREPTETAIRWLGQDLFPDHDDDIKVAVHPKGHAVLMLVRSGTKGAYGSVTLKLSKRQWTKLQKLAAAKTTES